MSLTCVALTWPRQAVLETLVVGAGGLGGPQQRQQPPHRHLVVENAFARIKASVCHDLTVFCLEILITLTLEAEQGNICLENNNTCQSLYVKTNEKPTGTDDSN